MKRETKTIRMRKVTSAQEYFDLLKAMKSQTNREDDAPESEANMLKPHKCPVCGKHEFTDFWSFEDCPVCGWMDDGYQEKYPDEDACANTMSLNEAKMNYSKTGRAR